MNEKCPYCTLPEKDIGIVEVAEPRIFAGVSGGYLKLFDEDYPGWTEHFEINYCPICGRKLREG